jgi:membrane fusion protein (multidrug efflux system)
MSRKSGAIIQWLGIAVLAAAVATGWLQRDRLAGLWADWTGEDGGAGPGRPPTLVEVARAERATIAERLSATGTLEAAEQVTVTAQTPGRIASILFAEGDAVQQDQALLMLERERAAAAVQEAAAQVQRQARALERRQALDARNFVAESEIDRVEAAAEQARARLRIATEELANRVVEAPFSGVVGRRLVSKGAFVQPGTPIATLSRVDTLDLLFDVPGAELGRVALGQRVEATTPAFPQRRFDGRVTFVGTRVEPATRTLPVEATFANTDGLLKPGMFLDLVLITGERRSVRVPEAAILTRGPNSLVYVVEADSPAAARTADDHPGVPDSGRQPPAAPPGRPDGEQSSDEPAAPLTVSRRPVVTGARRAGWVEITEGVSPGERVVVAGLQGLRDGMRVRIARRGAEGAGAGPAGAGSGEPAGARP